jgi:hypothetical protein
MQCPRCSSQKIIKNRHYSLSELNMVHTQQCSKKALIFLGVIKFKDEVKALITYFLLFGCSFLTLFFITDQQYSIAFSSGRYGGRKSICTPVALIRLSASLFL